MDVTTSDTMVSSFQSFEDALKDFMDSSPKAIVSNLIPDVPPMPSVEIVKEEIVDEGEKLVDVNNSTDDLSKEDSIMNNKAEAAVMVEGAVAPQNSIEILAEIPATNMDTMAATPIVSTTPVMMPNVVAAPTVVPAATATTSKVAKDDSTKKKGRKTAEVDYNAEATRLTTNWANMSWLERYDGILNMAHETASSSAKKLGLTPGNRILQSVRDGRILKGDQLKMVIAFYKAAPEIAARPNIAELITEEMFTQKIAK